MHKLCISIATAIRGMLPAIHLRVTDLRPDPLIDATVSVLVARSRSFRLSFSASPPLTCWRKRSFGIDSAVSTGCRIGLGSPTACKWRLTVSCRLSLVLASCLALGSAPAAIAQPTLGEQRATCGYKDVVVVYKGTAELVTACDALNELTAYFRAIGFEVTPSGSLEFADHPVDIAGSHGYFDHGAARVVVYRSALIRPWGRVWDHTMMASFLRHELAHMMVWRVGKNAGHLPREWHEFIAYAIQFDLMEPKLLDRILASQANVQPFGGLLEVNEFTYGIGPEYFAVAAYKTYLVRGKAQLIQQLLIGEIVPPSVSYPLR